MEKLLRRIQKVSDKSFFNTTKAGLRQSIIILSIPEGIAVAYVFKSLFSGRNDINSALGFLIGAIVAYILYEIMIYRMAVNGNIKASHFFTICASIIAWGGWYSAFLTKTEGNVIMQSNDIDFVNLCLASFFVFANCIALIIYNDIIATKLNAVKSSALSEEKNLENKLADKRKEESENFLKNNNLYKNKGKRNPKLEVIKPDYQNKDWHTKYAN